MWVQQRPRHFGRGLLAGVPALGFGWLAAWFAGHRQHVDCSGVCVNGVDDGFGWACVVGEGCDAVPFCFALFGGFGDAL